MITVVHVQTVLNNVFLKYRITVDLKVETDITIIAASPIWRDAILVMMYVDTLKIDVIVFISKVIMCLTSHIPDTFQYQSQLFVDTDNIIRWYQRKNVQITDE